MKAMLLAATAVGAALAGSILFLRRKAIRNPQEELSATSATPPVTRSQFSMG